MKELSIEQKAEAYDKAVEGIQEILSSGQDSIKMSRLQLRLQGIFPELKESEDEQIRKVLVGWFKRYKEQDTCGSEMFNGIPTDNILTWLEKQVEQKSAWSEEDALRLEEAIYMIKARGWIRGDDAVKLVLDWLKSLKQRIGK